MKNIYDSTRNSYRSEALVPGHDPGSLAYRDGIVIPTQEPMHPGAVPALRIGRGSFQLRFIRPKGETAFFDLRAG